MRGVYRLNSGGRLDRDRPLEFTFNGRIYSGYVGDTLASALLANGVRLVGRSFKYHRPRGIVGSGSEEPNALVQLGKNPRTSPNQIATQIELYDQDDLISPVVLDSFFGEDLYASLISSNGFEEVYSSLGEGSIKSWNGDNLVEYEKSIYQPRKLISLDDYLVAINTDGSL